MSKELKDLVRAANMSGNPDRILIEGVWVDLVNHEILSDDPEEIAAVLKVIEKLCMTPSN